MKTLALWLTIALGGGLLHAQESAAHSPRTGPVPSPGALHTSHSALLTSEATRPQASVVVFLVRHAEKVDDSRDPPLSEAGKARAELLADVLRDAGITVIWSTDFQRTRGTAEPLARRLGIEIRSYNPSALELFARQLRALPGRHLVVGHSNTTPDLARALGGDPRGTIDDAEYDRLYAITLGSASVTTALMRYGERYNP